MDTRTIHVLHLDLPTSFFPTGSFTREYEYAYLQIIDYLL